MHRVAPTVVAAPTPGLRPGTALAAVAAFAVLALVGRTALVSGEPRD